MTLWGLKGNTNVKAFRTIPGTYWSLLIISVPIVFCINLYYNPCGTFLPSIVYTYVSPCDIWRYLRTRTMYNSPLGPQRLALCLAYRNISIYIWGWMSIGMTDSGKHMYHLHCREKFVLQWKSLLCLEHFFLGYPVLILWKHWAFYCLWVILQFCKL